MLFKQNEVPLWKSNQCKTWNHLVSPPYLSFLNFLNFFLQLISWLNKTELLIFRFLVSKGSPLHCSSCSHLSAIRLPAVTQEKIYSSTPILLPFKMPLSTILPVPALGYEKFFYHSGFSSTATTSFKILLERNNHSFLWVPTAYCSNLYLPYQSAFYYN